MHVAIGFDMRYPPFCNKSFLYFLYIYFLLVMLYITIKIIIFLEKYI